MKVDHFFDGGCGCKTLRFLIILQALVASTGLAFGDEIHQAIREGNLKEVEVLLKDHPDLISSSNDQSFGGGTPLHVAAHSGHKDIVEYLIANGYSIFRANCAMKSDHRGQFRTGLVWIAPFGNPIHLDGVGREPRLKFPTKPIGAVPGLPKSKLTEGPV